MSDRVQVTGLVGSLRDESYTRIAIARALAGGESVGAGTELVDLRTYDLPVFDPNDRDAGDAEHLQRTVGDADAILLGTPMYHGSYASPLKNALDYCGFDEFRDTTVGLLATSGGGLPGGTFEHMAAIAHTLNAWVLPRMAAIPSAYDHIDDGEVVDDDTADRLDDLGGALVTWAGIESPER